MGIESRLHAYIAIVIIIIVCVCVKTRSRRWFNSPTGSTHCTSDTRHIDTNLRTVIDPAAVLESNTEASLHGCTISRGSKVFTADTQYDQIWHPREIRSPVVVHLRRFMLSWYRDVNRVSLVQRNGIWWSHVGVIIIIVCGESRPSTRQGLSPVAYNTH